MRYFTVIIRFFRFVFSDTNTISETLIPPPPPPPKKKKKNVQNCCVFREISHAVNKLFENESEAEWVSEFISLYPIHAIHVIGLYSRTNEQMLLVGKPNKEPQQTFCDVQQLNYNGAFKKAISKQVMQARKTLYSMLTTAKQMQLSVDIQCHLFDHLILPILLYGSEVWGHEDIYKIKLKFSIGNSLDLNYL